MSPAFSHDFLKRLSAFSKLSSGSTITLVTRNSPLSHSPKALPVYHAPLPVATGPPACGFNWAGWMSPGGAGGAPSRDHTDSRALCGVSMGPRDREAAPPPSPAASEPKREGRDLTEEGGEDEGDDGHQLDEDVHAGARRVLEGVAHRVAHHGRLVRVRALAAEVAGLDVLLGVVPGAARVRHEEREEDSHQRRSGQEAPERFLAQEEADSGGQHDRRQSGHDHLLERRVFGVRGAP